MIQTTTLVLG